MGVTAFVSIACRYKVSNQVDSSGGCLSETFQHKVRCMVVRYSAVWNGHLRTSALSRLALSFLQVHCDKCLRVSRCCVLLWFVRHHRTGKRLQLSVVIRLGLLNSGLDTGWWHGFWRILQFFYVLLKFCEKVLFSNKLYVLTTNFMQHWLLRCAIRLWSSKLC